MTIKARHGFKARNLMVKQNLGWAPHFLRWKQPKNHHKQKPMWLPVLKPSKNHKSRIRKSTSYTVIGWETKIADTLRLFTYHSSNRLKVYFCMSLLWHPCHNSVIWKSKSSTGTQWLQKLTFWKKETPAKPQQAFSITATINDIKLI